MTKTMRIWGAVTLAIAALSMFASPSTATAPKPAPSGTIEGGTGVIFAGEQPAGERWGCEYAAECRAWLKSKCKPALAGRDPALTASIVDVGALADGHTRRSFRWRAGAKVHPGALIQFWRQNCTEIPDTERHTHNPYINRCGTCEPFPIPNGARWMTVSGNWTTVHFTWSLTPAEAKPPTRSSEPSTARMGRTAPL
ncbi:MAG TPA: hypothetical protein VMY88_07285 [Acidimicrobiales bacterium]|nr:hypothetical protein [Acidimicrobiales bacterium]